jgi:uncharacterized membrane protein YdjX (TVP38/TMEM64 family)
MLLAASMFVFFNLDTLQEDLINFLDSVLEFGTLAPVIFVIVYIIATILFIPGILLTPSAGYIFGIFWGTIYCIIGSTVGATFAFLIGRYIARDWVSEKIKGNGRVELQQIDDAIAAEGWKIVFLTRLSPIFPGNNFWFGLTKISLRDYIFASWTGMLPGIFMYVYLGTLAKELSTVGIEEVTSSTTSSLEYIILLIGFIATLLIIFYITTIARKALSKRLPPVEVEHIHSSPIPEV